MIKSLIKLALLLLVGILVYNFFFGTAQEKEQSRQIFSEVKDLTSSAVQLLRTEKEKFDDGKYDEAIDKIGGLINNLKNKAEQLENNKELIDQIADLQDRKRELETKIRENQVPSEYGSQQEPQIKTPEKKKEIEEDWEKLLRETRDVMNEMERKAQ